MISYVDKAIAYAEAVVNRQKAACKYEVQACQRFLDDLELSKNEDYPFELSKQRANHACELMESFPHVKGVWATHKDNTIKLEPWQCFIVVSIFGWVEKATQLRRFRGAYLEVCRKNGKSVLAALIGLLMFAADGEHGAEVYSGATTEEQAWEVFRPAKLMTEKTPSFREALGVDAAAKSLFILDNGSRFKPVIGKPGDGPSPHCAIVDEYHEHLTDELYDTMKTGMGARSQPLLLVVTTAGTDIAGPCYALRGDMVKVLEGTVNNDRQFAIIYTIDEGDDWTTEEALEKANPNIGVSVSREYLKQQQQDAILSARKQNVFKTKHLDVWCHARSPWMNMESWVRAADPSLFLEDFERETCWMGVDVASKKDLSACCAVFVRKIDGVSHYYPFSWVWLPEEAATDIAKPHYQEWANQQRLIVTEGNMLDLDVIEEHIQAFGLKHKIAECAFDPWGAYQLASNLQEGKRGRRLNMVELAMNTRTFSEPMKMLAALVDAGRVHHSGDPILSWCVSNVTVRPDANENIFPRKEREESKIDAAIAMILAFNRVLLGENEKESVYTRRGIRAL